MRSQSPRRPKPPLDSPQPEASDLDASFPALPSFLAQYPSREIVKNAMGMQRDSVQRGWLEYYKDRLGLIPATCSVEGCLGHADVGGHVWIKRFLPASRTYIIPLCYYHNNQRDAEFAIKPDVVLCPLS